MTRYQLYYVLNVPSARDPLWLAEQAVLGGASVVQLRGKTLSGLQLHELAVALKRILTPHGVPLIIDDRLDVALTVRADGVHVGRADVPFEQVGRVAPDLLLGVSCYGDLGRAARAVQAGADYVAFGAMYPTGTKPEAEVVPLSVLSEARALGVPVLAIGGITLGNAADVLEAGANGVAVVSAIQEAPSPQDAARSLAELSTDRSTA